MCSWCLDILQQISTSKFSDAASLHTNLFQWYDEFFVNPMSKGECKNVTQNMKC